jgi:hypothetical protein
VTAGNFELVLRTLTRRRPFRVFTVELKGGHRLEVDSPLAVMVQAGVAVFIAPGGVRIMFDHKSVNFIFNAHAVQLT